MDRIPTRRVTVQVPTSYKGARAGQRLTLFQTGGTVTAPPPPAKVTKGDVAQSNVQQVILEGDPLYSAGEEYLVMIEEGPQGTMRTVSPEGRYRYDTQIGTLSPMVKNTVTSQVSSATPQPL